MTREHDVADLLSRDIDTLLRDTGRLESETPPEDYGELLCLARTLLQVDFSAHSHLKEPLRKRLLRHPVLLATRNQHPAPRIRGYFWRRHPGLLGVTLAMAFVVAMTLAWPGTLTAGAQRFESLIARFVLQRSPPGHYLVVSVPHHQTGDTAVLPESPRITLVRGGIYPVTFVTGQTRNWVLHTSIGTFRGDAPPWLDPVVQRFVTLQETQAAVECRLHRPGYLPQGYTFREGVVTPIDVIYLFYSGPRADIVLAQMGGHDSLSALAGALPMPFLTTRTDKPIRTVQLRDWPATWIEGHGLIWEADRTAFLVGGPELGLDEATRIAMSLD